MSGGHYAVLPVGNKFWICWMPAAPDAAPQQILEVGNAQIAERIAEKLNRQNARPPSAADAAAKESKS